MHYSLGRFLHFIHRAGEQKAWILESKKTGQPNGLKAPTISPYAIVEDTMSEDQKDVRLLQKMHLLP